MSARKNIYASPIRPQWTSEDLTVPTTTYHQLQQTTTLESTTTTDLVEIYQRGTPDSMGCRTTDPRFTLTGLFWSSFDVTESIGPKSSVSYSEDGINVQVGLSSYLLFGVEKNPPHSSGKPYPLE